jgi:hypothetical protein
MERRGSPLVILVMVLAGAGPVARAQAPTTTTTTPAATRAAALTAAAGPAEQLVATVTGVEGMVQVRDTSDGPWRRAVAGMVVGEGAEFRTGPRSAVRCFIAPDQTITLDRLGVVKLLQAVREGNRVKTSVGMPYGRTRYDIEEAGVEHQSTMVTPGSTLAIRGTKVSVFDQPPFAPSAVSLTGRAEFRTPKRQVAFGGKGQGRTDVSADADTAAQYSLLRTFVDPASSFGRPAADRKLINQLQAKGDIVLRGGELALATGGPVTDPQLREFIGGQGRFNIALRWFEPVDFDLFVLTPDAAGRPAFTLGNPSYRGSVFKDIGLFEGPQDVPAVTAARTADGGRIKFDQIALGRGGLELASWNTPVPAVPYTIAVALYDHRDRDPNYVFGGRFRVDAYLDGKTVPLLQNYTFVRDTGLAPEYGPAFEGELPAAHRGGLVLVRPPESFQGDVALTAVDLSPAAGVKAGAAAAGKPKGRGGRGAATPAPAPVKAKASGKRR